MDRVPLLDWRIRPPFAKDERSADDVAFAARTAASSASPLAASMSSGSSASVKPSV